MLTRLKVNGFKNLVDVDVRFGPFTCIAGANGVGKSNLFDAIRFLSALADRPLIEAANIIRNDEGRNAAIRNLFHRTGDSYADTMSFEAEMIVPSEGLDDLGQPAKARSTFLHYNVTLAYRTDDNPGTHGSLELLAERLVHINLDEAQHQLAFPHTVQWRKSAVLVHRAGDALISTEGEGPQRVIKRHQDGKQGRPLTLPAANLPRTVLSATNAAESPTALLAKREMQSWRLIQLEPTSLRRPDEFGAPDRLGTDGSHLPATLYRLARAENGTANGTAAAEERMTQLYRRVANRLSALVSDIQSIHVDSDEKRELLTVQVTDHSGTSYPARALSDGTLRFLALAVFDLEPTLSGLLCFEEPENGIHPERIPAILQLLQDIATDTNWAIDRDNPLRQVIINTHSPAVVGQIPDDALLVAELKDTLRDGYRFKRVCFSGLPDTWRTTGNDAQPSVARGQLIGYLNPNAPGHTTGTRVIDRADLQLLLPHFAENRP